MADDSTQTGAAQADPNDFPRSVKHTYPDGSEVFGCPPFPDKSPLEQQAAALRAATPPQDTFARAEMAREAAEKAAAEEKAAREAAAQAAVDRQNAMFTANQVQQTGGSSAAGGNGTGDDPNAGGPDSAAGGNTSSAT